MSLLTKFVCRIYVASCNRKVNRQPTDHLCASGNCAKAGGGDFCWYEHNNREFKPELIYEHQWMGILFSGVILKCLSVDFLSLLTALLRYNWYTKNCTYLMYILWWLGHRQTPMIKHHHRNQGNRHTQHLPRFPSVTFLLLCVCMCVLEIQHEIYPLNKVWSA